MSNTIICKVINTTEDDLRQWCSHNLTGKFRVRGEYSHEKQIREYEKQIRKPDSPVPVYVIMVLDSDRLRLRDAYDVADTSWSVVGMERL